MKKIVAGLLISVAYFSLISCSQLSGFGKDNHPKPSPLVAFTPALPVKTLWTANVGNGSANMQMPLPLAAEQGVVYVSNYNGVVAAYDINTGKRYWVTQTKAKITSGPGVGNHLVAIGTTDGKIIALEQTSGKILWQRTLSTQILAVPQIAADKVIVKTIDGKLYGLNSADGSISWQYDHSTSQYMLRASSAPRISQDRVITGFNDGKLAAVKLTDGQLLWERTVALPQGAALVQQLVGVDTSPLIIEKAIYVAAYQGNLMAMTTDAKELLWQRPFSTYNDLTAVNNLLVATDIDSQVWAINRRTGRVEWRQPQLTARRITGAAIQDKAIVVGDAEGYLHWLALDDGHVVARVKVDSKGINAAPIVANGTLLVVTKAGKLSAYRVGN
jgi:outer membrane protein assembly factor BamB